jgi:hypothetical protein
LHDFALLTRVQEHILLAGACPARRSAGPRPARGSSSCSQPVGAGCGRAAMDGGVRAADGGLRAAVGGVRAAGGGMRAAMDEGVCTADGGVRATTNGALAAQCGSCPVALC